MKSISLPIVIEHDKHGYTAWCPSLQGCMTEGSSYEEVRRNMEDAVQLYVQDLEEVPPGSDDVSVTTITIAISSHAKTAKAHRR